jgi:hypothetical protein
MVVTIIDFDRKIWMAASVTPWVLSHVFGTRIIKVTLHLTPVSSLLSVNTSGEKGVFNLYKAYGIV